MREFDENGLRLAEYQARLFEQSTIREDCSSKVFLRRFFYSDLLKKLDQNESSLLSLDVEEGLESIENQFGKSEYGHKMFSKEAMFWMGYMYRYISYTRDIETPFLMRLFVPEQMNEIYYTYHTQNPEWCVESLLSINHLDGNILDRNWRLKQSIQKKGK